MALNMMQIMFAVLDDISRYENVFFFFFLREGEIECFT